jgi:HEAT repeat protein
MRACVEALGDLGAGSPEASEALRRALAYRSTDMRYAAILALIKLGDKSALPAIEEAAKADPDPLVQEAARRAREALK